MKSSKPVFLFGGLVALLTLAGTACFNPNSPVSAPARESDILLESGYIYQIFRRLPDCT
ncbi:MAG: hypothetical protein LBG08_01305 [Spirochaetaceae bacterium]|jgi:hypothetical protein|nr:hypothetical protein [Spirochaetaceae bacterium]